MILKSIKYFLTVSLALFAMQIQANSSLIAAKPVLFINTNYKGTVDDKAIQTGKVFILVKPNPSRLTGKEWVFQTAKFNTYAAVGWRDLENDQAFKSVMAAKLNKAGTIKVYTLANIGYTQLQAENLHQNGEAFLINRHGDRIKIQEIYLPFISHPIYDEQKQEKNKVN